MIEQTKAMELALETVYETIIEWDEGGGKRSRRELARRIVALTEQPAQPQQEPVAYAVYHRMGGSKSLHWPEQHSPEGDANEYQLLPLYTSPPTLSLAQRTWVNATTWRGLTAEERSTICENAGTWREAMKVIEAELKEKNCG